MPRTSGCSCMFLSSPRPQARRPSLLTSPARSTDFEHPPDHPSWVSGRAEGDKRQGVLVPGVVHAPSFRPSHRHLLTALDPEPWQASAASPGAIVVPTARPWTWPRSGIGFAARLAKAAGSPLVLITSKDAATATSLARISESVRAATDGSPPDGLMLQLPATETTK